MPALMLLWIAAVMADEKKLANSSALGINTLFLCLKSRKLFAPFVRRRIELRTAQSEE